MKLKLKRNDQIGFTFFLAFAISTTLIYHFEEQFDSQAWRSKPSQRHKMLDYIIEEKLFLNASKQEVIDVLGEPNQNLNNKKDAFIYNLGKPESFFDKKNKQMIITFKNDKAIGVSELDAN
ncbi:hypothetical protein ACFQ1Q_06690 [Winogradskyella litorisediminis]|uniref:SmpA / OmlA family protein n=1 Tax=Winogradskyella litorisediminis TaxID=1156618 RepID=A0ABW3N5L3_9FLAO